MQVPTRLTPENLGRDIVIAALTTIVFVAVQLQASLNDGVLGFPPTYDDIAYYVDAAAECVAQAQLANPGVAYGCHDGKYLPYENYGFDAAFPICVMHHAPTQKWRGFVAEPLRVLRPGGFFAVFEHNPLKALTNRTVNRFPFNREALLLAVDG
jgi:SAM-dependent methyltransferase